MEGVADDGECVSGTARAVELNAGRLGVDADTERRDVGDVDEDGGVADSFDVETVSVMS